MLPLALNLLKMRQSVKDKNIKHDDAILQNGTRRKRDTYETVM